MISSFLKTRDYTKLKLLQFIGTRKKTNIQELLSTFDLSRASIKRNISEINTFFSSTLETSSCNINQDNLFNFSLETPSELNVTHLYYKYLNYLLNDSLQFQIVHYFFNKSSLSLSKLSSGLYISDNLAYKTIVQLNESLTYFKLSITIKNNILQLNGKEKNIRLMFWIILVTGSLNSKWPFMHYSHEFIKDSFSLFRKNHLIDKSLSTQIKVDFYLTILLERLSKGHYQSLFPKMSDIVIQALLDVNDITQSLKYFPTNVPTIKNKTIENNERKSFNFIMRFIDPTMDSEENKINIGKKFLELDTPLTKFHKDLNTSFISTYFNKNKDTLLPVFMYYTVLYHEFSYHYSYSQEDLINVNPLNENQLIFKKSNFSNSLVTFVRSFSKNKNLSFELSDTSLQIIGLLHYSLYVSFFKDSLSVYIQYSRTPIGNDFIKGKLQHIFSEETLTFTTNSTQADIIISDILEYENSQAEVFFIEDIYNIKLWKELYSFIQDLLFELYHL